MAEAILSQLLETIFSNLAPAALEELQQVWGVDVEKELQNLESSLSAIQAVLEDAEERQFESKAVQDWLQKLKHVAYDADDLVDEIVTAQQSKAAESATEAGKKRKWPVWNYFSSFLNSSQQDMACRIRDINARLDKIAKERRDLHFEARCGSKQLEIIREQRQSISSVRDESSQVLGRIDDTERLINFLLSDSSGNKNISVISVVGMAGVGKTTIAQVVYNHKRVMDNFELRAWVCVSEHFDVERLTKEIIATASKRTCDLSGIDSLQCYLRDLLNGKKFLLVLDDVWSENSRDWERLEAPFTFAAKGSKIVVTTRSQAVSHAIQTTCTHNLKGLSKNDCWSLFVSQAFIDGNANAYPDLLRIGEELVNKCGGLPLAAKALGGLLSSKREVREWENILKSPIWELRGPASNILPALRLSYQHLPAHLKRCFTFCSIFPKNYKFRKQQLVQLWVAHGFIRPEEGKQIEDTGSEYLNDLLLRSFFQPSLLSECENFKSYNMHDLVHDLAQFMSVDECFQMEQGKSHCVLRKIRHLSCSVSDRETRNLEPFYESKGLRTFLTVRGVHKKVPHEIFERLRFIRVLDLSYVNVTELPNSIGNLRHLRYLNLSSSGIKELPESICRIYNMQTLLLSWCANLMELPNEMRKLTNLRHLDLQGCFDIVSIPPQIGRLTCLQTLPLFVIGEGRERGIAELKELTDIRGSLTIRKLEKVSDAEEAVQANLKNKSFIDELLLVWSSEGNQSSQQNEGNVEEVGEWLQPHPKLKKLSFSGYTGVNFPSWMMKMDILLSNLAVVYLIDCRRCSILPPLGRLPYLKRLCIDAMLNLEQWQETVAGGDFPCLEVLHIRNCPQLRQIPHNSLTNVKSLKISKCERLISLPLLPSLKELIIGDLCNLEEWHDAGEAHLPLLQKLSISRCPKLKLWPRILPVITELKVSICGGFEDRESDERLLNSVSRLMSLSSLTFYEIPSLTSMPQGILRALTQLKDLEIRDCKALEMLVDGENGLPDESLPSTLTSLRLLRCPNLKSLPRGLHALTSLCTLIIDSCPGVTSLPEEGLPTALQTLEIRRCPALEEKCVKDVGADWPKISHIPHLLF